MLRGWIVNLDGKKVVLEEGVEINIGDSDCTAIFKNYYLSVRCDGVTLHYDGMMAGMIQIPLEEGLSFEQRLLPPEKPAGGLGLCWDNMNGGRPNWQVLKLTFCLFFCFRPTMLREPYFFAEKLLPDNANVLSLAGPNHFTRSSKIMTRQRVTLVLRVLNI